jgi:hypothetical protein
MELTKIAIERLNDDEKNALLKNFNDKSNASLKAHRELVGTLSSGNQELIAKAFEDWCARINTIEELSFREVRRICGIETDERAPTLQ